MKQSRMDHTISFFHTSSIAILLQLYTSSNCGENDVTITLKQHFYCRTQTLLWFCPLSHFHTFMLTFQKSRATILGSSPASSTSPPGQADIGYKCPHLLLELTTLQRTFERFHSHSAWILPLIGCPILVESPYSHLHK